MVNCNPETVSTDYDTSDRLYFEPLTLEDVLAICDVEKPWGVIVQFGGQTPLKLAVRARRRRRADPRHQRRRDRSRRGSRAVRRGDGRSSALRAPRWGIARTLDEARTRRAADRLPGDGAPELRARRPRDGARLRRARARGLLRALPARVGAGGRGNDESATVGFPLLDRRVPRRRGRARRRRRRRSRPARSSSAA